MDLSESRCMVFDCLLGNLGGYQLGCFGCSDRSYLKAPTHMLAYVKFHQRVCWCKNLSCKLGTVGSVVTGVPSVVQLYLLSKELDRKAELCRLARFHACF